MPFVRALLLGFSFGSVVLGSVPECGAESWSRFRGPNGGGHGGSVTLPGELTAESFAWRTALPGRGHGSPVAHGERVFLLSAETGDGDTSTRIVLAVDAATGTILWQRRFEAARHRLHVRNSFASSTPAVDDRRVFVCWATPESYDVLALDQRDGGLLWRRSLGPFESEHGFGASPVVQDGLLIVANDQEGESSLVALEVETGETAWQIPRRSGPAAYGAPCLYEHPDGRRELVFAGQANGLTGVDPATGRVRWSLDLFPKRVVASPIRVGDLVVAQCGVGSNGTLLAAVRPPTKEDEQPRIEYEIRRGAPYVPTPVGHDGLLYLLHDRGTLHCVEAESGETVYNERIGGTFSGSPVIAGDALLAMTDNGEVVVLALGRRFEVLARHPLGETSRSTPAVAGGGIYFRTESQLFRLGGPQP